MFDENSRREELDKTYIEKLDDYGLDTFYDDIIFQEKLMIAEAIKEFVEKLKDNIENYCTDAEDAIIIVDRVFKECEANGYDDNGNPIKYGLS